MRTMTDCDDMPGWLVPGIDGWSRGERIGTGMYGGRCWPVLGPGIDYSGAMKMRWAFGGFVVVAVLVVWIGRPGWGNE